MEQANSSAPQTEDSSSDSFADDDQVLLAIRTNARPVGLLQLDQFILFDEAGEPQSILFQGSELPRLYACGRLQSETHEQIQGIQLARIGPLIGWACDINPPLFVAPPALLLASDRVRVQLMEPAAYYKPMFERVRRMAYACGRIFMSIVRDFDAEFDAVLDKARISSKEAQQTALFMLLQADYHRRAVNQLPQSCFITELRRRASVELEKTLPPLLVEENQCSCAISALPLMHHGMWADECRKEIKPRSSNNPRAADGTFLKSNKKSKATKKTSSRRAAHDTKTVHVTLIGSEEEEVVVRQDK